MYQAIVFLPLLGAILAGVIALVGARARFPGKGPVAGAENTTTDHGPYHGEPGVHGGGVIHLPITRKKRRNYPPPPAHGRPN